MGYLFFFEWKDWCGWLSFHWKGEYVNTYINTSLHMILELSIVCVTIVIIVYLLTRVFVAKSYEQAAINKRMSLMRKAKSKKSSSEYEEDSSLVEALLDELGIPVGLAMPVIQGYIQGMMKNQKPPTGPQQNYT